EVRLGLRRWGGLLAALDDAFRLTVHVTPAGVQAAKLFRGERSIPRQRSAPQTDQPNDTRKQPHEEPPPLLAIGRPHDEAAQATGDQEDSDAPGQHLAPFAAADLIVEVLHTKPYLALR